ncbi:MAG TPA: MarP family serine protease [Candidatus Saccharimonadales bacterium]|nr:MarP family serine protease [Candidatus Saccharimonadales bacterium]
MFVDILIIFLLLSAIMRGRELGLVRQVCSAVGFFVGLFIGAAIEPRLVNLAHTQLSRALLTLLITLGSAMLFLSLGEFVGVTLKLKLQKHLEELNKADVLLGAGAGAVTLLLTVWLITPILVRLPFQGLTDSVRNSVIVTRLNTTLPPAPNVIAGLGHLIDPNGFPQVFAGLEPAPPSDVPLPKSLGSLLPAVKADKASVVKIEGNGCGGIVEGSGFVAGDGFVATNAHVVAGITNPIVIDNNGSHQGSVILFDPDLDFAVLRVDNLAGKVLKINTGSVASKTPGAVLGYPGGGGFSAGPATVLDEFTAVGRNIYNQGATKRDVLEVKANIIPGNSGGPLINKDGDVIGVVFAESSSYNQVGYALATQKVVSELHQAEVSDSTVSSGTCTD